MLGVTLYLFLPILLMYIPERVKKQGRTKIEFFREEYEALISRVPGLFDDLVPTGEPKLFNDKTTVK